MTDRERLITKFTLTEEGRFANDKLDCETICGIARNSFPKEFAEAMIIYKTNGLLAVQNYAFEFYDYNFWHPLYDSIEDTSLLQQLFDFGVNAGKPTAIKLLQLSINKCRDEIYLSVDGVFGNHTLEAVNKISKENKAGLSESLLHNTYEDVIEKWYRRRKKFWYYGKGWLRRLRKVFNL